MTSQNVSERRSFNFYIMLKYSERKNTRLKYYNYSNNGLYFITICTKDKKCILCDFLKTDDYKTITKLTVIGNVVKEAIDYYKCNNKTKIDKYVIMPNHIHLLVGVCAGGTSRMPSPTESAITQRANEEIPKFVSSFKRYTNKITDFDIWQRSFYDHIIRNQQDYEKIWKYIEDNPAKWTTDEYY